jgi:hypothetical protein
LSVFILSSFITLVFIQCFYSFFYLFLCFLKFSIFVVLKFLECLLYILVDHIQCHLHKISLITCRISSFRKFLWASLGLCHSLFSFCWSLDLGICFLHFPLVPVLICYWGGKWFPSFFHLLIFALATVTVLVLCVIQYCLTWNSNCDNI